MRLSRPAHPAWSALSSEIDGVGGLPQGYGAIPSGLPAQEISLLPPTKFRQNHPFPLDPVHLAVFIQWASVVVFCYIICIVDHCCKRTDV